MTIDDEPWPPKTISMTAEDVKRQVEITIEYYNHLLPLLKDRCKDEGHKFGDPVRDDIIVKAVYGPLPQTDDVVDWRSCGQECIKEGSRTPAFTRTCDICGHKDQRRAKTQEVVKCPEF